MSTGLTKQLPFFVLHSPPLCICSLVSTHPLTCISTDFSSMATPDLLAVTLRLPARHNGSIVTMNEGLKRAASLSLRCRTRIDPLWTMTKSAEDACHPRNFPLGIPGVNTRWFDMIGSFWSKGDDNTRALARAVYSRSKVLFRAVEPLSSWGFTVSGICFIAVVFKLFSTRPDLEMHHRNVEFRIFLETYYNVFIKSCSWWLYLLFDK